MIRSMTGFGQAELKSKEGHFRAEIKSVNHKFLELSVRIPGAFAEYEEFIRKTTSQKIRRGKVMIFISCPDPSTMSSKLIVNEHLARQVHHNALAVQKLLKLKNVSDDALLKEVLSYPEVLVKESSSEKKNVYSKSFEKVFTAALEDYDKARAKEGSALANDLKKRVGEIASAMKVIQKRIPVAAAEFKKNLRSRMNDFIKNGELDKDRLTIEVAQYLKSSDISEEVTRMASHLDSMTKALKEVGEVGRKIDFIAQEMTRETNTVGAKSEDKDITNAVIRIKSAIEKIREQAQNVE